jgi:hypothetical protein
MKRLKVTFYIIQKETLIQVKKDYKIMTEDMLKQNRELIEKSFNNIFQTLKS